VFTNGDVPVLIVGNFQSDGSGSRSIAQELAMRLPAAGCPVVTTSSKRPKLLRLIDMVTTAWRWRRSYAVAQIDVFSGAAFVWAEAVSATLSLAGKPYVLTLHGGNLPQFASRRSGRVGRLLRSATAVTTPSHYLLERFAAIRPDLRFIPNGVDVQAYPAKTRNGVGPRLIWLRAFHQVYNPTLAVRVVQLVATRFPGVRLIMIGPDKHDGSRQASEHLAQALGVADRIEFRGPIPKDHVPSVLGEADILLNTASVDNAPVSVLEAMACGLCVVTTNVGGIPDLVDQERTGLLVPPDDAAAMANAVLRILEEPALAGRLSQAAREKAMQFDWTPIVAAWRALLASAAAKAS
jgi:glycosyltransferase involved in cell wall biosynthesis